MNPRVPQPKTVPVLGNLLNLDPQAPVQSLVNLSKRYDGIFKMDLPSRSFYVVTSHRLTNELCDESRFDKRLHGPLQEIRTFAGDGLFTANTEEPNWQLAHKILMPAFGAASMKSLFPPMLDIADQMFTKWSRLGNGAEVDVVDNMTRLTLDTIALAAFDYRFNSFYKDEMHPFVASMVRGLAESGQRSRRISSLNKVLVKKQKQYRDDTKLMHEISDELIEQRKKAGKSSGPKDLLSIMLNAKHPETGETLSDENIRYQMVTFLIAGHETTSGLLSFAIYALLKNPEALKKARANVDEVLGGDTPTFEAVTKLTYLDQVLKETLRLWPTAPAFAIRPKQYAVLDDKYPFTKDDTLLVLLPGLHRDPSIWENPETFDPDRMERSKFESLPQNAWKPFGNGQRACIGRAFALQEATLVLAMLLQRFDFELTNPNQELRVKETLTLKPEDLSIRLKIRADRPKPNQRTNVVQKSDAQFALQSSTKISIFYGSNSGSSEAFARRIAKDAEAQGNAVICEPLDTATRSLPKEGVALIVTSSYEGQPPDNAKNFVSWLESSQEDLKGVKYAVFGCGNRDWHRTFQAVPQKVDALLAQKGAERIYELGAADERGDFFGDFDRWYSALWTAVAKSLGQELTGKLSSAQLQVEIVPKARELAVKTHSLKPATVVEIKELVDLSKPNARSKKHVELKLPVELTYRAGDYISILPSNPPETIKRILKLFDLDADSAAQVKQAGSHISLPEGRSFSVVEILASHVELSLPAGRAQIEKLTEKCPCPPERMALLNYIQSEETYQKEILEKRVSIASLLEEYRSVSLSFSEFLQMLPPLKPRQYSISSSPLWKPDHCTLTVAVVNAPAFHGKGQFLGAASYFLAHAKPGDEVPVLPKASSQAFHLPDDPRVPLILACAGTGIAPFRGFLQERMILKKQGKEVGEALLFFGCDDPDTDYLYRSELQEYEAAGIVRLKPAFSSKPENGVTFVQDRIWQDRQEVIDFYLNGAKGFVCGDGKRMAPAVRAAFLKIYQDHTKKSDAEVEAWFQELEKHSRYVADVFS